MNIDINCDLGEGESLGLTEALMCNITSANIGDRNTKDCIALAKKYGVHVGAHPRHPAGRDDVDVTADELESLIREQVRAFDKLHHIKLHGVLYHATEGDPSLAEAYLNLIQREWPNVIVYAKCGGVVQRLARGVRVWGEGFADRSYRRDGTLVPRSRPDALITDVQAAVCQAEELIRRLKAQTICVHADTPGAPAIAEALKRMVRELRLSSRE
jgi:UPF0271 protein